ncbi:VCBS repeat-containing protein [Frankia sp. AiPs1]|nr:VCBS repeat-containing protein [Frankia sp. AiPs1]
MPSAKSTVPPARPTAPAGDRPSATPGRPTGPAPDGDVDGDGRPDRMLLSPQGELTVAYSGGGRDSVTLSSGSPGDLKLLGAVDADADGHAEVFARVVQGANAQSATVLRYVHGHLVQVTMGGDHASLNLGGGLTNQFAWSCDTRSGEIVQWQRRSGENDQTFQGEVRRYRFEGRTLVLTSRTPFATSGDKPVPGVPTKAGCGSLDVSL